MTVRSLPDGTRVQAIADAAGNLTVLTAGELPPAPAGRQGDVAWYVPYTAVHPRTVVGAPRDAVWVDVRSTPIAYYAALHEIWERGETFALLEHDVVCRPDVIEAFEACPEPWCAFGYADICCQDETGFSPCMEAWRNTLGCTRFRKELIEAVPDAISSIPRDQWDWHVTCDGLGNGLRAAGFQHHWHFGPVEHHHHDRHLAACA